MFSLRQYGRHQHSQIKKEMVLAKTQQKRSSEGWLKLMNWSRSWQPFCFSFVTLRPDFAESTQRMHSDLGGFWPGNSLSKLVMIIDLTRRGGCLKWLSMWKDAPWFTFHRAINLATWAMTIRCNIPSPISVRNFQSTRDSTIPLLSGQSCCPLSY